MKVSIPDDKGKKRIVHDVTAGYVVVLSTSWGCLNHSCLSLQVAIRIQA